ncbi:hypothetical protein VTH82DRAFT_2451 [Thermothelomyces myriococcoides]
MSPTLPNQTPIPSSPALRARRYKVPLACDTCRLRKLKCDGIRPACGRCRQKSSLRDSCRYSVRTDPRPKVPSSLTSCSLESPGPSPQVPLSCAPALTINSEEPDGVETGSLCATGNPDDSSFATQIKKAIDERLGLPFPHKQPCPTPMINAPLFGQLSLKHTGDASPAHRDNVLPPRKHADRLMDIYWRRMHPLEPLLDEERFTHSYEALYMGRDLDVDERIFVCTLNTMFALSTQLEESVQPADQRDEAIMDTCLKKWERSLPPGLRSEPVPDSGGTEPGAIGQRVLLHLRLLHARTVLFRPMLARLCLAQPAAGRSSAGNASDRSLGQRILQDCASVCVESSRRMIDLVYETHDAADPTRAAAIIPWWYRILYLFVASQHILAAMLRPDAFPPPATSDGLSKALSVLRAQEHLSPCVTRCVKSFETMSQKIATIHQSTADGMQASEVPFACFQDVFHDLGFDTESSLLGMDDVSWFSTEGWNL